MMPIRTQHFLPTTLQTLPIRTQNEIKFVEPEMQKFTYFVAVYLRNQERQALIIGYLFFSL